MAFAVTFPGIDFVIPTESSMHLMVTRAARDVDLRMTITITRDTAMSAMTMENIVYYRFLASSSVNERDENEAYLPFSTRVMALYQILCIGLPGIFHKGQLFTFTNSPIVKRSWRVGEDDRLPLTIDNLVLTASITELEATPPLPYRSAFNVAVSLPIELMIP